MDKNKNEKKSCWRLEKRTRGSVNNKKGEKKKKKIEKGNFKKKKVWKKGK